MDFRKTMTVMKQQMNRKNLLFCIAAAGGMLTTTFIMATAPEHVPTEPVEKTWPVSTTVIELDDLAPELVVFGRVESHRHSELSSAIDAPVQTVHVSEGDSVQAGDPIMTLDAAAAQLVYAQRMADLAATRASLDAMTSDFASERDILERLKELQALAEHRVSRLVDLYSKQLVSTAEVDTLRQDVAQRAIELSRQQALVDSQPQRLERARAELRNAEAAAAEQQLRVDQSVIRAPFAGRITRIDVSEGNRVQPGQRLVALYDAENLRVRARLPSALIPALRTSLRSGETVSGAIAGVPGRAALAQLAGTMESGSSGIDAFFNLPANSNVETGRTLEMTLQMPPVADVAALPQHSLHDNNTIYTVSEQRLQRLPVTVHGTRRNERGGVDVLVSSGSLRDGDEVLSSDMAQAREGLLVETTTSRESAEPYPV